MTEIFDITNRALIYITKDDIYKDLTILNIVEVLLLIIITIVFVIICGKFAKIIIDLFRDLIFSQEKNN